MTLVDSNVLLDVLGPDPQWRAWSVMQLDDAAGDGLAINPIIYAEVAPRFPDAAAVDAFLKSANIAVLDFARADLFMAGAAHRAYRRNGGEQTRLLADFLIGALAATRGCAILTRDPRPYRTYFPAVRLIAP